MVGSARFVVCPFCGGSEVGSPTVARTEGINGIIRNILECKDCGLMFEVHYGTNAFRVLVKSVPGVDLKDNSGIS